MKRNHKIVLLFLAVAFASLLAVAGVIFSRHQPPIGATGPANWATNGSYCVLAYPFVNTNNPTEDFSSIGTNKGSLGAATAKPTWITNIAPTSSWYSFDGGDNIDAGLKPVYFSLGVLTNGTPAADKSWTIAAWLRTATLSGNPTYFSILGAGCAQQRIYNACGGDGNFYLELWSTNGGRIRYNTSIQVLFAGSKWCHVAIVCHPAGAICGDGDLNIYTNGVDAPVTYTLLNSPYLGQSPPVTSLLVGHDNNGSNCVPWNGGIDEFGFYTTALSAASCYALFTNNSVAHPR